MLFPIDDLLDDAACYRLLLSVLHPDGLHCPKGHPLEAGQAPHDRHREPVLDYRCRTCGKVFNRTSSPIPVVTPAGISGRRAYPAVFAASSCGRGTVSPVSTATIAARRYALGSSPLSIALSTMV